MTRTKITPPDTTSPRVIRGGGWNYGGACGSQARTRGETRRAPTNNSVGFRTALAGRAKR